MKKTKNKYKHVRVFLVPSSENSSDTIGSRIEYSVPTVFKDKYYNSISLKLTDCNRSIHWDIEANKDGERKLNKAISVLQDALKDLKQMKKLPKEEKSKIKVKVVD